MKNTFLILFALTLISCSTQKTAVLEERTPANFQSCLELMVSIMDYKPYTGYSSKVFSKAKSLNELESLYGGENLLWIQQNLSAEEIKLNNENLRKLAKAKYSFTEQKGKISSVTTADSELIYQSMDLSEVNKNHWCYDTKGTIGFCFGRATIAHMEAMARNIHPEAVKKIWIAGDMKEWGHHVATMIHTDKGWMVLDTNIGKPVTVDYWLDYYKPFKAKDAKEVMAFVTQAGRFGPYNTSAYNAIDLFNTNSTDYKKAKDYFNGYFHDYFKSLDNVMNAPLEKAKK